MKHFSEMQNALLRADLFRMAALAFSEPTDERRADLRESLEALMDCLRGSDLTDVLATVTIALRNSDPFRLRLQYYSLFDTSMPVPIMESAYHRADRGATLGDVAGFYSAFGFDLPSRDGSPDTLPHELAFLAWLSLKEAYAIEHHLPDEAAVTRDAAVKFITDHTGRWTELFADKLLLCTDAPFYRSATDLLRRTLERAQADLRIETIVPLDSASTDPEPESIECPAACRGNE